MYCDTTLHSRKSFNIVGKYSTKIASKHHHFTKTLTRDTPSLRPLPCTTQHLSPSPIPFPSTVVAHLNLLIVVSVLMYYWNLHLITLNCMQWNMRVLLLPHCSIRVGLHYSNLNRHITYIRPILTIVMHTLIAKELAARSGILQYTIASPTYRPMLDLTPVFSNNLSLCYWRINIFKSLNVHQMDPTRRVLELYVSFLNI